MTHEEVAILWKDANGWDVRGYTNTLEDLERFAKLVAAKALSQPKQEPPPWWPAVENILNEYGLQAIDFVAEFKKALAQPEQEPVAYQDTAEKCRLETVPANGTLFHTTPPQRTWQGLTNNDLQPIAEEYRILFGSWVHDFARAIEAKLKEKNT